MIARNESTFQDKRVSELVTSDQQIDTHVSLGAFALRRLYIGNYTWKKHIEGLKVVYKKVRMHSACSRRKV